MKKPKVTSKDKFKLLERNKDALDAYRFNFVKSQLRRISVWKWNAGNVAMDRQRLERGLYQCESCKGSFGPKQINRDHVEPVIAVTGWVNWEEYINRLFVKSEGIQILCIACHECKTQTENILRVKNNQKPIKIKKKVIKDLTPKKKRSIIRK